MGSRFGVAAMGKVVLLSLYGVFVFRVQVPHIVVVFTTGPSLQNVP